MFDFNDAGHVQKKAMPFYFQEFGDGAHNDFTRIDVRMNKQNRVAD